MKSDGYPALYRRFETERTRPARELLARVRLNHAQHLTDPGCGPGNSTALLAESWPEAQITGLDNSPACLTSFDALTALFFPAC